MECLGCKGGGTCRAWPAASRLQCVAERSARGATRATEPRQTDAPPAPQVLLNKGVQEGNILFLSLVAAPEAVHRVCRAFPKLKLITSEIDEGLEAYRVVPGVGEFGDRYFCD